MKAIWFLALFFLLGACQADTATQISAISDGNSEGNQQQATAEVSDTITEIKEDMILVELSQQILKNETLMWIRVNDKTVVTDYQENPLTTGQLAVQGEITATLGDICAESTPRICSADRLYLRREN